jgi:hypothetical protein
MTPKEAFKKLYEKVGNQYIPLGFVGKPKGTRDELCLKVDNAFTELEVLKLQKEKLIKTIKSLISKTEAWEEKENKTDFEKGIARGYSTMLDQLLVGICFNEEEK